MLVVPAAVIDDLLELVNVSVARLASEPALADALRGAAAAARAEMVMEPG